MGKICVLDKSVAEKIAAGEVVQRPSSVVKELLENSVDALARSVTVEIRQGGISYIRVSDNGSGIAAEDVETAFLRHATSKIHSADDLCAIKTMGFRGEALCSVAAVSRSEIITKTVSASEGCRVVCEGGIITERAEAGCPEGTTITVRNLFYNTPARKKFLKRDATEAAYVADICEKIALANPNVALRHIRDGKDVFFTPGDGKLENTVYALFGRDYASNMTEVYYEADGVRVTGMIGSSSLSRPNRNMQYFFVNHRSVVGKSLTAALSEGYKNSLMIGRFPVAVLNIEIAPEDVDVNVHPAKTEVKFSDESKVYNAIYWAVKNRLAKEADEKIVPVPRQNAFTLPMRPIESIQGTINIKTAAKPQLSFKPYTPPEKAAEKKAVSTPLPQGVAEEEDVPSVRVLGQLFSTYIVAQMGEELLLADQHAAHERLKYEELKRKGGVCPPQLLAVPISVTMTHEEFEVLKSNAEFFNKSGFEYEPFGENTVVLRAVPSSVSAEDAKDLMLSLCADMEPSGDFEASRDKALYTVACKAAIKANRFMSVREMEILLSDAMAMEGISTCPHGRPIFVHLTKTQIEKMFKRIQ